MSGSPVDDAARSSPPERVGFVGLGQIGKPIARRLTDWPGGLVVCDAVPGAAQSFVDRGVPSASTPAEVAQQCTVISIMVRDDAQVDEVLSGDAGILSTAQPGTVVAVHSTVEAGTPSRLAALAAESGVEVVDAPVSGGPVGAADGTLAVMVGGTAEAVERVRPPFERFASLVAHVGPIGAGTRCKLARNLITFASYSAVGEALRLAEAAGVDLNLLGEVVRHSDRVTGGPGSIMIRPTAAPLAADDGLRDIFAHTVELGSKDLRLALELGAEVGVELPVAGLALEQLAAAFGLVDDAIDEGEHR